MDGAVTNVAIRRRVQAGSEKSLGSLSLSSLSRLNPVEQASGWNKLNLVKVLVLCVEMIMLVMVTRLTKHLLMYHDLMSGGWLCLSLPPGAGLCVLGLGSAHASLLGSGQVLGDPPLCLVSVTCDT